MEAIECLQNQPGQIGKHQSAGLHAHEQAAVICRGEEVSTAIDLQRQQSLKFDFKEMVK